MPLLINSKSFSPYFCRFFIRFFEFISAFIILSACQNTSTSSDHISNNETKKIDHLLELMEQRLDIAPKVAKSKWNSGLAVDDPQRESYILNDITEQARLMNISGCNLKLVRNFFQHQFNAGKIIQINLLTDWHTLFPPSYKFNDALDLTRDIRPLLDKLTPELITTYCDAQPILLKPNSQHYLLLKANVILRDDVDGKARREAVGFIHDESKQ